MTASEVEATTIVAAPMRAMDPTDAPSAVKIGLGIFKDVCSKFEDAI